MSEGNSSLAPVRLPGKPARFVWFLVFGVELVAIFFAGYWRWRTREVWGVGLHERDIPKVQLRKRATLMGHTSKVNAVAFSPDCRMLASGTRGAPDWTVRLWDVANASELKSAEPRKSPVDVLAFSPNGDVLAAGFLDGTIVLLDAKTLQQRKRLGPTRDSAWVASLAFAPDGKSIAVGYSNDIIVLYDTLAEQPPIVLRHEGLIFSVAFSPDGGTLASASSSATIMLWDPVTGTQRAKLTGHKNTVHCVAFSRDGRTLYSGSEDGTVRRWQLPSGKRDGLVSGGGWVWGVRVTDNGELLLIVNMRSIDIRLASSGKLLRRIEMPVRLPRQFVPFSSDGRLLAVLEKALAKPSENIELWELAEELTENRDRSDVSHSPGPGQGRRLDAESATVPIAAKDERSP